MTPSVFMVGEIEFNKTRLLKSISNPLSAQLYIGITKKQSLLMHFGDTNFDTMRKVIVSIPCSLEKT